MKKIILIILVVGVLLAGGWYFTTQKGSSPVSKPGSDTTQNVSDDDTYSGTLQKILGLGKSLKCTWSMEGAEGTSWIKNKNVYTEISAQGYESRAIMKDNCMWAWAEGQAQGVKTCYESTEEMYEELDKSEQQAQPDAGQSTEEVAIPSDVEYNCQPASIADSQFDPPADVNFLDMDELVPQTTEDMQDMSEEDMQELQDKMQEMLPEGM